VRFLIDDLGNFEKLKPMENKYSIFKTDWGYFAVLTNDKGIIRTYLPTDTYNEAKKALLANVGRAKEDQTILPELTQAIIDYYKGTYVNFNSLNFTLYFENLTNFSKKVLLTCRSLSIGQTITYSRLAQLAGFPGAARAAGTVMANNKWPLLIGCHRVMCSDGVIGRFSGTGGDETKRKMLEHEQQILINKGYINDYKEDRVFQRPCCNRAVFASNQGRKYDISIGTNWA